MLVEFNALPDHSRIWIFPASRRLSEMEAAELSAIVDKYLASWEAHHVPVEASWELRYDQFLIIAANPDMTAPSGCSIDDMTRAIKLLGVKFGSDFFSAMKIFYRDSAEVNIVSRLQFKELAASGAVDAETTVFDNSITTLGELRRGKWELAASASWHSSLLPSELAM